MNTARWLSFSQGVGVLILGLRLGPTMRASDYVRTMGSFTDGHVGQLNINIEIHPDGRL